MATLEDIQHHYDVDNNFYKLFLDKKYRAYSCGVWDESETLEIAQHKKLERIAKFSNVKKDDVVLDVGCGWGGLMNYLIDFHAVKRVDGITLSQDQFDFIKDENNNQINVDLLSWIDLDPETKYDSIVSVGAFEHFASLQDKFENNHGAVYRSFFQKCHDISTDTAGLSLQTIIVSRPPNSLTELRDVKFLLKEIFPGSSLPTLTDVQEAVIGLYEIAEIKLIGNDYAKTLQSWNERLAENKEKIIKEYGIKLYDKYSKYFTVADNGFTSSSINLLQVSLKKVITSSAR